MAVLAILSVGTLPEPTIKLNACDSVLINNTSSPNSCLLDALLSYQDPDSISWA